MPDKHDPNERNANKPSQDNQNPQKEVSLIDHVRAIIAKLDRETLEEHLIKQVLKDGELLKTLTYDYGQEDKKIQLAYDTAYEALKSVELAFEDIGYDEEAMDAMWDFAGDEIDPIYKQARQTPHPETAVKLLLAVLEACLDMESDQTDIVSTTMDDALEAFHKLIAIQKDTKARCQILKTLLDYYHQDALRVIDEIGMKFFHIMVATHCAEHKQVLHDLLVALETDEELIAYEQAQIQVALYQHLTALFAPNQAKTYLMRRLDNDTLLKMAYDRAMTEADYPLAVQLAEQMLDRLAKPYDYEKYETYLVEALLKQGDQTRAKPILKEHTLKGNHQAFKRYEQCFTDTALTQAIDELIDVLYKQESTSSLLIHITVKYDRLNTLMAYVEQFPKVITEAYTHLPKVFEARIFKVFEHRILKMASHANDRVAYQTLARVYHHAQKAVGQKAHQIERQLLLDYPKKRALKDELKKARIIAF